jgi:hypothetical protein
MTAPGLRRFIEGTRAKTVPGERCEMCAEPLGPDHSHVADLKGRTVMCACRACYLLFTREGAAQNRYRAIPDRHRYDPEFRMTPAQWDELGVPVNLIFVFHNAEQDRHVAFYPSPAGATESMLPTEAWSEILAANASVADLAPDVEAVVLRRTGDRFEGYLVPIDACYELVGRMRMNWRGFDGGEDVWREVDAFFDRVVERAEDARPAGDGT